MDHMSLFLKLLYELQILIGSSTEYDLIRLSKTLRQLLLDGDAIVNLVNRQLRLDIRFRVARIDSTKHPGDWIFPDIVCSGLNEPSLALKLDKFLSHRTGFASGRYITVRDLIKYAATCLGGVHFKLDSAGDHGHIAKFHTESVRKGLSPVLLALRDIARVTRDALIPVRDHLIDRRRFDGGKGWTALLCLEILSAPPDEDNFILDIGTDDSRDRFSIYVDSRGDLTFRVIDRVGVRSYLRAGRVGGFIPENQPLMMACEMSTIGETSLLSLRVGEWDHVEIVTGSELERVGDPFHFVTGSDCFGKKRTSIFVYQELLVGTPVSPEVLAEIAEGFWSKAKEVGIGVHYSGNQFMHSGGHPNFPEI